MAGTRVRVWEVETIVGDYKGDVAAAAEHLDVPRHVVDGVLAYAEAFAEETAAARAAGQPTLEEIRQLLPGLVVVDVDAPAP